MTRCSWVSANTRLTPLLAVAALLGGCGESRTAAVPAPFVGCWHQVAAASLSGLGIDDPREQGLLTIGTAEALCDLDGLPRGPVAISEFGGDPGLGSGRVVLANGLRLYLNVGHGAGDYAVPGGSVVGDAGWLDLHVLRATADGSEEPVARLRLWSAPAVATAALAFAARHAPSPPAVPALAAPASAPALSAPSAHVVGASLPRDADRRFTLAAAATGDQGLAAAALSLLRLHEQAGAAQVAATFRLEVLAAQRELLQLLEQARHGDAFALSEADHRAARLEGFTTAYAAWLASTP
jgi:hypothetical protein